VRQPVRARRRVLRNQAPGGVEVRIDGQAIPDAAYYVDYDTFGDAESAPPLAIEVWRGDAFVDSLDLRPDYCRILCRQESHDCELGDLLSGLLEVSVEPDGRLSPIEGSCTDGDLTYAFAY
jgi:hypothetical protein